MRKTKRLARHRRHGVDQKHFLRLLTFFHETLRDIHVLLISSWPFIFIVGVVFITAYVFYASNAQINVTSTRKSQPYRSSSLLQTRADDEDDKTKTKVGLNNLGNTCFMNAVLQCLSHTPPLMDYCLRGSHLSDINYRSQTRGDLIKVFADFMKNMAESKSKSAISPYQLRREVQRYASRFCGDNQQDAQEFLRYLLQGLHDDINRVKYKNNTRRQNFKASDESSSWRSYRECDDSLIVDLFAGQLKSTLKCTVCNNESITYDPFWDLSLPIPEVSRSTSLRQCFQLFSSPEILDGPNKPLCEVCKKKARSSKKIEVSKFPKVLVIHLKRFSGTNYGHKLSTVVECPMKITSEFSSSSNSLGDDFSYNLYGVVDHEGSNNSGHYTAKCKNQLSEEWYEFNDSMVSKASNIVSHKSYILFYIQERCFRK
ncbi:ubiquitin carboxyl-terminal hydrolase 2-like isoform X2 [Uloborus diversus]|uniref:ubiquitin carboxyl-terminal hydrolase 2-like isoform X2 n=1 Tax=Uloborus diversus TaxID=327109 RepID=UPI002409A57D|nr:ubiquitin carboxyl-terminal hydrolase 2-like isoform X2 [Uloborus diversus]